jgi:choline dehydrogenase-like flavoprotein
MKPIDSRSLATSQEPAVRAQVAVVGAGAMGITLGLALARRGLDTVVLESGGLDAEPDAQALADLESPGHALRGDVISHPRRLGGATTQWGGRCIAHTGFDFEHRPWVDGSGWPITRDELLPYEREVSALLNVSTDKDARAILGPELEALRALIGPADDLSLRMFGWASLVDFSTGLRDAIDQEPRLRLYHHANVVAIRRDQDSDLIDHLDVATDAGNIVVQADNYVLAGGGIENPRLLLASAPREQGGLGDLGGHVGQRVMDHPKAGEVTAGGTINPGPALAANWFRRHHNGGGSIQFHFALSEAIQRREELLHHGLYIEPALRAWLSPGYLAMTALRQRARERRIDLGAIPDAARLLRGLPELARYYRADQRGDPLELVSLHVVTQLEQPPTNGSSITLTNRRDRFGVPIPAFDWRIGAAEHRGARRLHQLLDEWLRVRDLGTLDSPLLNDPNAELDYVNASHPMGATRMARSKADGVVDENLRVFTTSNLYATGTSVLPTGGYANPTFTALALTLRLADHLST